MQSHPEAKPFRKTGLPLFEELGALFDGICFCCLFTLNELNIFMLIFKSYTIIYVIHKAKALLPPDQFVLAIQKQCFSLHYSHICCMHLFILQIFTRSDIFTGSCFVEVIYCNRLALYTKMMPAFSMCNCSM